MGGKKAWAVFEDGRVMALDQARPAPRNFPAEWGDFFVMRSDARPAGVRPGIPQPGPAGFAPKDAGGAFQDAGRPDAALAGAEPYALELTRDEVEVTRTDRPSHHPGRPNRRIAEARSRGPVRDTAERIIQRRERSPRGGQTRAFQYDAAGRLSRVFYDGGLAESYQYDAQGRREREGNGRRGFLERRYFYGPDNRLLMTRSGLACAGYEHDPAGFRSAKTEMGVTGTNQPERATRYRYAPDGRLLAVLLPDGRTVEYTHDAQGRRAEKRINGRTMEHYEWLDRIRPAMVVADGVKMEFLYSGTRLPDMMVRDGRTYRLYYDQVGSLRVVAAGLGSPVKELVYDSFGNVLEDTNPAFRVPLGFAGGLHDPDTGLVRFGYRDYDPDTGRFTALDPLGDAGGDSDWYGYCLDDPVNLVDPEGLMGTVYESPIDPKRNGEELGEVIAPKVKRFEAFKDMAPAKGIELVAVPAVMTAGKKMDYLKKAKERTSAWERQAYEKLADDVSYPGEVIDSQTKQYGFNPGNEIVESIKKLFP